MSRQHNKEVAEDTLAIVKRGDYYLNGIRHSIAKQVKYCIEQTCVIESVTQVKDGEFEAKYTVISVIDSTTIEAALNAQEKCLILNFASAKNPGGGVLNGASAQEESICKVSALYPCLELQKKFYKDNANIGGPFYSGKMLYSPDVPIIKNDDGELVEPKYHSFLTAPAANVNAGSVSADAINKYMKEAIRKVLHFAALMGYKHLILGAWGCGVFGNDAKDIAKLFKQHLDTFKAFDTVTFAIMGGNALRAFKEVFEE